MDARIGKLVAPAIGDIRALGSGDTVWITPEANQRKDFGRYIDAVAAAVSRGADVRWAR